jgi:hypothetical protein
LDITLLKSVRVVEAPGLASQKNRVTVRRVVAAVALPYFNLPESVRVVTVADWKKAASMSLVHLARVAVGHFIGDRGSWWIAFETWFRTFA